MYVQEPSENLSGKRTIVTDIIAKSILPEHESKIRKVKRAYPQRAHGKSAESHEHQGVFRVFSECFQGIFRVLSRYFQSVFKVFSGRFRVFSVVFFPMPFPGMAFGPFQ